MRNILVVISIMLIVAIVATTLWGWLGVLRKHMNSPEGWAKIMSKRRLYKPNKLFSYLTDKYNAKIHTSFPTAKVLWLTYDESELPKIRTLSLPSMFAIKATHGSGMNIVIKDSQPNWNDIQSKCVKWIHQTYAYGSKDNGEHHYRDIRPGIMIEEYLEIQQELKFFCFHGKALFIEHLREGDLSTCAWYTLGWEKLDIRCADPVYKGIERAPNNLAEIIRLVNLDVNQLGLDFVRYDVILTSNGAYFGEYTFTPAGFSSPFYPISFNKLLGSFLKTSNNDFEKIQEYRSTSQ